MQMRDSLPSLLARVRDEAVSPTRKSELTRHVPGRDHELANDRGVPVFHVVYRSDVFSGNEQYVLGRVGVKVSESEHFLAVEDDRRGQVAS